MSSVKVKICGLNDGASVSAAAANGASYAGFVFYARSPRAVTAEHAGKLIALLPPSVMPVGLFVDPTDGELEQVPGMAPLKAIQLHGNETPGRVAEIRKLTSLFIIKAVGIASAQDIAAAHEYEQVADMLLLDAKAAPESALPGGNATVFDWALLKDETFALPWMLAGGLTAENIAEAVAATGARALDVSSGVEDAPGRKNTSKIKAFLDAARAIETSY